MIGRNEVLQKKEKLLVDELVRVRVSVRCRQKPAVVLVQFQFWGLFGLSANNVNPQIEHMPLSISFTHSRFGLSL